jgi:hypothetical protein
MSKKNCKCENLNVISVNNLHLHDFACGVTWPFTLYMHNISPHTFLIDGQSHNFRWLCLNINVFFLIDWYPPIGTPLDPTIS